MANKTVTVKASSGDYTTLNAALSGESTNLVSTLDGILTIDCYNFADTTAADTGTGYTTNATHYINIIANDAHAGKFGTTSYRLIVSNSGSFALRLQGQYVKVTGLLIENTGTGPNTIAYQGTVTFHEFIRCILRTGVGSGDTVYTISNGSYGPTEYVRFINCIAINKSTSAGAPCCGFGSSVVTLYNCTFISKAGIAFASSRNFHVLKNCLGFSTSGAAFDSESWSADSDYNASDDATAPGTNSHTNHTFSFVDAANDDYHLLSTDVGAINLGVDLSAVFTTDIDGETRPTGAGTWDIGADEYVAAGGLKIPVAMKHYGQQRRR
jgi:hypothetical protein